MKFLLATALLAASAVTASGEATYFSGDALEGITDYYGAEDFCDTLGLVLADETEWCTYAKANSDDRTAKSSVCASRWWSRASLNADSTFLVVAIRRCVRSL